MCRNEYLWSKGLIQGSYTEIVQDAVFNHLLWFKGNLPFELIKFLSNYLFLSKGWSGINPFPDKPWFLRVYGTSLLKTLWEKEKMLVTSIFSFSHSVFYSIKEINPHFSNIQFVVCKCFQFSHVQNSVVWERVKLHLLTALV